MDSELSKVSFLFSAFSSGAIVAAHAKGKSLNWVGYSLSIAGATGMIADAKVCYDQGRNLSCRSVVSLAVNTAQFLAGIIIIHKPELFFEQEVQQEVHCNRELQGLIILMEQVDEPMVVDLPHAPKS